MSLGKKYFCEGAKKARSQPSHSKCTKFETLVTNDNNSLAYNITAFQATYWAAPPLPRPDTQHPQRRNVVAGHGPMGGAVADVAESGEGSPRGPGGPGGPGGAGGGRGAGQHRVAPAGAQVAPRRARQGSGITPLMERPSRAALAQPPPPRAQRLERTSSGSLAQAISEGSPPTGQPPHQPESRSATGDT